MCLLNHFCFHHQVQTLHFYKKDQKLCTIIYRLNFQGPGVTFAFATSRLRSTSTSEVQFNFMSDVLLNGMVISTNSTNYLQASY
jgi:hypothetical protein